MFEPDTKSTEHKYAVCTT